MGKQSSRILYRGKDHKDILVSDNTITYRPRYFYSNKVYIGSELVWEKLFPSKCIVCNGQVGIHIYDIENRYFDVMPFFYDKGSGSGSFGNRGVVMTNNLNEIGGIFVGKYARHDFQTNRPEYSGSFYSKNLKEFKRLPIYEGFGSSWTENARLCASSSVFSIAQNKNGEIVKNVILNRESEKSDFPISGKGENIEIVMRGLSIGTIKYTFDIDGNKIEEVKITVDEETSDPRYSFDYDIFCRVGSSVYSMGFSGSYIIGTKLAVGKLIGTNLKFYRFLTENCSEFLSIPFENEIILYAMAKEIIEVFSIKENDITKLNTFKYIEIKSDDGEIINCYYSWFQRNEAPFPRCEIGSVSSLTLINGEAIITNEYGLIGTSFIYYSEEDYVPAWIYLDNPYFLESDNNRICKFRL